MARDGSKTGGRQKGTPNKATGQIKTMVISFIGQNWEQVQKDFNSKRLHPRDRLAFLEKLLKYAVPIMGSTNASLEIKKQLDSLSDDDLDRVVNMIISKEAGEEGSIDGEDEE